MYVCMYADMHVYVHVNVYTCLLVNVCVCMQARLLAGTLWSQEHNDGNIMKHTNKHVQKHAHTATHIHLHTILCSHLTHRHIDPKPIQIDREVFHNHPKIPDSRHQSVNMC